MKPLTVIAQTNLELLLEYFPCNVGDQWTYNIAFGDIEPVFHNKVTWKSGTPYKNPYENMLKNSNIKGNFTYDLETSTSLDIPIYTTIDLPRDDENYISYLEFGRFCDYKSISNKPKERRRNFKLILKVKEKSNKQGGLLNYNNGFEIEVIRDDANLFFDKKLFWCIRENECDVIEVITYPYYRVPNDMLYENGNDGYSIKTLLFSKSHDIDNVKSDSTNELYFQKLTRNNLHFKRKYKLYENKSIGEHVYYFNAFTEDIYYEKGKGLAFLKQTMGDDVLMTWTLANFSKR